MDEPNHPHIAWDLGVPSRSARPLAYDLRCDVVVVGAGFAGLTTAYLLAREGRDVVVLDHGPIAGGESGRTTAHLSFVMDDRFTRLEAIHGRRRAQLAWESHAAAIQCVSDIVINEAIACDFARVDGYLFDPPEGPRRVRGELRAARRLGVACEQVERAPMRSYDTGRAARFPNQAQLHPRRYLEGLADAIERLGGLVFTGPGGPHVVEVHGGHGARVRTRDGRTVHASAIVLATNSPILDRVVLHTKQAPYRTYVVALRVPRGSVERALYWDTADPYHYVRTHASDDLHDLLIVGGEDHKAGTPDDPEARFERLRAWTRARFPSAGAVEHAWSGLVYEPSDGLAFIGRNPLDADNVYVCTGDSGQGTTHGTIAGLLITDLIQGRANPWTALYDPGRVRLSSSSLFAYARENADVAGRYAQRLLGATAPGEVADVAQVRPGEAAIVRHDGHPLAVYRDETGALHARSAICTHLGCVVGWNGAEKRWECPCHGSRFAATGEVINGPATEDLARPGGVEAGEATERVPAAGVKEPEPAK